MPVSGSSLEAKRKLRLQNCLQTILDLRDELDATPFGISFLPEIGSLENFLSRLDHVQIDESEILLIEQATDRFLSELRVLMGYSREEEPANGGLLQ